MQSKDVQQLLSGALWTELCEKVSGQLVECLGQVDQPGESKLTKEKVVKALELCQFLVKHVHQQKLSVDLEPLHKVLLSMTGKVCLNKTGKLEDTYWAVMKHFGVMKPKVDKAKPDQDADQDPAPKKKKGFLPESKKRKKRNNPIMESASDKPASTDQSGPEKGQAKKRNKKKAERKRPADGATASQPDTAKKSKTQTDSNPAKKKKKKPKQKKEGGAQM